MSQTKITIGHVPVNRGAWDENKRYYKDNIVQYLGGSYIANPPGYSVDNPDAYITSKPYESVPSQLNTGWSIFADGEQNNSVHINDAQQLSDAQKAQALANVGISGIDEEPTAASENLVKSGGVYKNTAYLLLDVNGYITGFAENNKTHIKAIQKINLYKGEKYIINATCNDNVLATTYFDLIDSSDNLIKSNNIAADTNSTTVEFIPTEDYAGVSIEVYSGRNNGQSINIECRKDSLHKRFENILGSIVDNLQIVSTGSTKTDSFETLLNQSYRIYLPTTTWTINDYSSISDTVTIFVVQYSGDEGVTWTDITETKVIKSDFDNRPNYFDFVAQATLCRIYVRADNGQTLTFQLYDGIGEKYAPIPPVDSLRNNIKEIEKTNTAQGIRIDNIAEDVTKNTDISINPFSINMDKIVRYEYKYFLLPILKKGVKYKAVATLNNTINAPLYIAIVNKGEQQSDDTTLWSLTIPADTLTNIDERQFADDLIGKYIRIYSSASNSQLNGKTLSITISSVGDSKDVNTNIAINPLRNEKYFWHGFSDKTSPSDAVIPFESVFDIDIAHRLGFKVMEANVCISSDDIPFVFHGSSGKFGSQFHHVDGTTDITNVDVNSVTAEWIETNVRYNSIYEKYRTAPARLVDWLHAIKRRGMIPLVECETDVVYDVANSVMGLDNYIAYNANRSKTSAIISNWKAYTTKEDILARCKKIGSPFYYCSAFEGFTNEQLVDVIDSIHKEGYLAGSAYVGNEGNNQKLLAAGVDFIAATYQVNNFDDGNICNLDSDVTFDEYIHNGTIGNGILVLENGGSVQPASEGNSVFIGKGLLHIRFNGSISINLGHIVNNTLSSDGSASLEISSYYLQQVPTFSITANGSVIIYDMCFKASKC